MTDTFSRSIDVNTHNQASWDHQAKQDCDWSRPVSSEVIAAARAGQWSVQLTHGALAEDWLGDVRGRRILCLASGGGQQAPVLAAVGAQVTVFDVSRSQLDQDRMVADREGLSLQTVQGDMRDLSVFADASFDIVFQPIANHYVDDVNPVWRECFRVLRPGGRLLAGFYNPVIFVGDRDPELFEKGLIRPVFSIPYADAADMDEEALKAKIGRGEALVFGHSLTDLIAGQIRAGFVITGFQEDPAPRPRFLIDRYLPTFLSTLAIREG